MNLIDRLSIKQLHNLLNLDDSNMEIVNSLVRKVRKNSYFDLLSDKNTLKNISKVVVNKSNLQDSSFKNSLINAVNTEDFPSILEKFGEIIPEKSKGDLTKFLSGNSAAARKILLTLIGLVVSSDNERADLELVDNIEISPPDVAYKPLKVYQSKICEEIRRAIDPSRGRIMVCMPTGTGKTRTSMEIISEWANAGKNILWLVDSIELMEQALECFSQVYCHVGVDSVNVCLVGFGFKGEIDQNKSNFVVGGLQTLNSMNHKKLSELSRNIDLVFFDEAHHLMARTYKKITDSLLTVENETRLVGLSATPFRTVGHETDDLIKYFRNSFVNLEAENDSRMLIESLVEKGVLAKPIWKNIDYDPQFILSEHDLVHLSSKQEVSKELLLKLANDFNRNFSILEVLQSEANLGKSVIYFGTTKDQSKNISVVLNCLGVKSIHIDQDTPSGQRRHAISEFRNGGISVLCNFGILTTGFDAPKIDTVVLGRVSSSKILINQMIGRGLRGYLLGGTEICNVFVPNDNLPHVVSTIEDVESLLTAWK